MLTIQASSAPLIALSAAYMHDDKISLIPYLQQWDDGNITFQNPIFTKVRDVEANKDTLLYMTSTHPVDYIVEDVGVTIDEAINNGTIALLSNNGNYMSVNGTTLWATATAIGDTEELGLIKNSDNTVSFVYNNTYLTVDPSDHWNMKLTNDASFVSLGYNKFTLIAHESYYVIQSVAIGTGSDGQTPPLINRYAKTAFGTGPLRATGTTRTGNSLFLLVNITAGGGVIPEQSYSGFNPNSWWVKYYNTINNESNQNNNLDVNVTDSVSGVEQNYLVNLPYKTKISVGNYNSTVRLGTIDVDFNNLKTVETPEYEYTVKHNEVGPERVKLREYDKIFSGTNQDYGYENPFLGFTSDVKGIIFKKDASTYFHYPRTAPVLSLSAAGIIEDGAIAGSCPFKSDTIWKKNANYSKNIWWGNSLQWQQGTWLCSWLSGSINGNSVPVWKDRWYNPGYISPSGALVTTPVSSVVVDEDTSMTFDPGVWYSYNHIGDKNNQSIVRTLTGDGTKLKLHYDDWASSIVDMSPYSNDGYIRGFTETTVINDKIRSSENQVLTLNGAGQYCYVPYNSSYDVTDELTHSCWVYANDWSNVKGNHILSNSFRGGWSLEWTNGFVNPLLPVVDSTYGHVLFLNIDNDVNVDKLLPPLSYDPELPPYATPVAILVDDKLYTWVIDNEYKKLYKIDYNGDIVKQVVFDSSLELTDIAIDSNNNIFVLNSGAISGYDSDCTALSSINIDPLTTPVISCIDVNSQDLVRGFPTLDVCYDNNDVPWTISAGDVYENGTLVLSGIEATNIVCSKDNYVWVLNNTTDFMKLSSGLLSLSGSITTNQTVSSRGINFTNEFVGGSYIDYVWMVQSAENRIYKYDTDGKEVLYIPIDDKINTNDYSAHDQNIMDFVVKGDFTGYDRSRKFKYNAYNQTPQIQSSITTRSGDDLTDSVLSIAATSVSDGWHQFTTTYDSVCGLAKFYVDTLLVDSASVVQGSTVYYRYDNSLSIGVESGVFRNLSDELQIDDYYFRGRVDDVRIYNLEITNPDIENIYMTRLNFYDISWNMPTGEQNYVEEIERFFKHKLPGIKSQYFNVRISNLGINNPETRTIIEEIVRETVNKLSPVYTELYQIIWE